MEYAGPFVLIYVRSAVAGLSQRSKVPLVEGLPRPDSYSKRSSLFPRRRRVPKATHDLKKCFPGHFSSVLSVRPQDPTRVSAIITGERYYFIQNLRPRRKVCKYMSRTKEERIDSGNTGMISLS